MTKQTKEAAHLRARPEWLALHSEPVLEPQQPIIDAHHHLWDRASMPYSVDDLLADASTGHDICATVAVECRTHYRKEGPEALQPVGETEWLVQTTPPSTGKGVRVAEAIVGHADLRLGAAVREVLQAQLAASQGRLRGIRHSTAWDADPIVLNPELGSRQSLLADPVFREGFAQLAPLGLAYDAWVYHPQLDEVLQLARAFPESTIVVDHAGGPIGIGGYAGRRDEVFKQWSASMRALSAAPNVRVKLGGLAMRISGTSFHTRDKPPASTELAAFWKPWIATCIEAFGAKRCMFESNFPVDKASHSYAVLWNAYKRLAQDCSAEEKNYLMARTAAATYRITDPLAPPVAAVKKGARP